MCDKHFDIIIIGAGISGVSAALAAVRQQNLSIALVESKSIGSNKTSPLVFRDVVTKYDIADCLNGQYSNFSFHNYQGSNIKYEFPESPLVVLDYRKACEKIFDKAISHSNKLEFIHKQVTDINGNNDRVNVSLKDGMRLQSKVLIDCSGKSQLVKSGLSDNGATYFSHVYGASFSDVKNLDGNICCFLLPQKEFGSGGGWYYSLSDNRVSFGYATISNNPEIDHIALKTCFESALNKFSPYSNLLEGANLDNDEFGTIPITYVKNFVRKNIVIAGDAAGMATNWMCMGIEPALKYGELAGVLSAKAVANDNLSELDGFQESWDKENKTAYESMDKFAAQFWTQGFDFWEWIIKNDLAYLSLNELMGRMKYNAHLIKKRNILMRSLKNKLKSIYNSDSDGVKAYVIKK